MFLCLSCKEMGCSLRKCKQQEDRKRINANISLWKVKRHLVKKRKEKQIANYVAWAESDEELMEILLALTTLDKHADEEEHAQNASNGVGYSINTFYSVPVWDESQESVNVFIIRQLANYGPIVKYSPIETRHTNKYILFTAQNLSTPKGKKIRKAIKTLIWIKFNIQVK